MKVIILFLILLASDISKWSKYLYSILCLNLEDKYRISSVWSDQIIKAGCRRNINLDFNLSPAQGE